MHEEMKTMILPDHDEIMRRLTATFDEPHMIEKFYPIIAKHAGHELNGNGIVMMLTLAVHDYADNMPPMMGSILLGSLDMFVDALVDDPEVKADAHELIKNAAARL